MIAAAEFYSPDTDDAPPQDEETQYDEQYLQYLQLGEHQATVALSRARRALKCAQGRPDLEHKYREEIKDSLIELRWMRYQLSRLLMTPEEYQTRCS